MNSYAKRDAILLTMRYPSYAAYLASPLWSSIRADALDRDRRICRIRGGQATQVHHRVYQLPDLNGKRTRNLLSLCRPCHLHLEFDGDRKLSAAGADRKFKAMCEASSRCKVCGHQQYLKNGMCRRCRRGVAQPWKFQRPKTQPIQPPDRPAVEQSRDRQFQTGERRSTERCPAQACVSARTL